MEEHDWLTNNNVTALLNFWQHCNLVLINDRKLRLFAAACGRRAWHLLTDDRSRLAVEAAEMFADGLVSSGTLAEAWSAAARVSAGAAAQVSAMAGRVQVDKVLVRSTWAAQIASSAAQASALAAAWNVTTSVRQVPPFVPTSTADFLRDVVNPFRPYAPPPGPRCGRCGGVGKASTHCDDCGHHGHLGRLPPAWVDATVVGLARAAYDHRADNGLLDAARLAVLADALEEAGCPSGSPCGECAQFGRDKAWEFAACHNATGPSVGGGELVDHLRSPAPHVRGCWALDFLLGRG